MKTNVIINGDSILEMKKIEDNSIDLIFADPPYFMRVEGVLNRVEGTEFDGCDDSWDKFSSLNEYENFTREWLKECHRILKPDGSIWVIGGMQCIYTIGAIMQQLGFWIINDVVWHKKNPTPNFMGTRLNNSHETLIWATKSKKAKFTFNYKTAKELNLDNVSEEEFVKGVRKQMGSVWRFSVCQGEERIKDSEGNKLHNTQKPIEMLKRIIAISSNIGDIVLDPFGGTMTTGAAAKILGRKYIMIEREQKYIDYGKIRLEETKEKIDDIANAIYDIKPIKVTINDMINNDELKAGEWFCSKDGTKVATLCNNGKLDYNGQVIDIHTCAALAKNVKAKRLNGFNMWYVERGGILVSISDIREKSRKKIKEMNNN